MSGRAALFGQPTNDMEDGAARTESSTDYLLELKTSFKPIHYGRHSKTENEKKHNFTMSIFFKQKDAFQNSFNGNMALIQFVLSQMFYVARVWAVLSNKPVVLLSR